MGDGTGIIGLKPLDSLKPTILKPISSKLEKNYENDCQSGFEEENVVESPDQTRDIIRTISTISALPTRLLPTAAGTIGNMSSLNEVDLTINNATTTVVTGDSGMDTISTNSS